MQRQPIGVLLPVVLGQQRDGHPRHSGLHHRRQTGAQAKIQQTLPTGLPD